MVFEQPPGAAASDATRDLDFAVSSEGPPYLVVSYDKQVLHRT
jgi:hypothetical protein